MNPAADARAALGATVEVLGARVEATVCFDPALSVFLGHFPGNPLVPGVHQVAAVAEAVRRGLGRPDLVIRAVVRCKWLHPLRPGDHACIQATWKEHADGWLVDGTVAVAGVSVCSVRLRLVAMPAPIAS